jgi:hypothetical protein
MKILGVALLTLIAFAIVFGGISYYSTRLAREAASTTYLTQEATTTPQATSTAKSYPAEPLVKTTSSPATPTNLPSANGPTTLPHMIGPSGPPPNY